mgnify:CR=1 FL=1
MNYTLIDFPMMKRLQIGAVLGLAMLLGCQGGQKSCGQAFRDWGKTPAERLAEDLNAVFATRQSATLAARVVDLQTGEELFAENPDEAVIPASNGKLAISAAGLDLFGPYHTFKTYLIVNGDDLWIVGTGDPGTGDPRLAESRGRQVTSVFDDWANALRRRGVSRVRGKLYYWDRALDDQWLHPNWKTSFHVDWYAAPVSGLNFNDNCIDVTAYPTDSGQPARLEVVPPNTFAVVENRAVTGGDGSIEITREAAAPKFTAKGGISRRAKYESKPITDPGAFFADAFRTHLGAAGIPIEGQTVRADTLPFGPAGPNVERIVAVHETSMPDVLRRINKNSQNLFAEALSKAMGREFALRRDGQSVPGSWALGEEATKDFLSRHHINATEYVAADGSGLARENRVTARLITDLLQVMWRHPYGKVWRDSLAVGGVDGTIRNRQKDFPGRIFAKTGYIGGVRSLSGYAQAEGGRWLAFSFIFNDIEGDVKPFEKLQDDAAWTLIHFPDRAPPRVIAEAPTSQPASTPTTQPSVQPSEAPAAPPVSPTTQPDAGG